MKSNPLAAAWNSAPRVPRPGSIREFKERLNEVIEEHNLQQVYSRTERGYLRNQPPGGIWPRTDGEAVEPRAAELA